MQGQTCVHALQPLPHRSCRGAFAVLRRLPRLLPAQVSAGISTASPSSQGAQTLCQPQVIGNRRIPKESVLARLFSRQNDLYDPAVVERDFNSLWNTGYFEDVRIERVDTPKCVQLIIYRAAKSRPSGRSTTRDSTAVTQSDVLERFKKAKVEVSVESQYDPTKVKRAEVVLKDLLAEHGHQFATIKPRSRRFRRRLCASPSTSRKVRRSRWVRSPSRATTTERSHAARRDEEPEADRDTALDHSGEPVCADLRRQQAG